MGDRWKKVFKIILWVEWMIDDEKLEDRSLARCYTREIRVMGIWHINMYMSRFRAEVDWLERRRL
jgi:hypothetical protein